MSHCQPVAWMVYTQDGQSCYVTDNPADISPNQRALPLYTEPSSPDEVIHPAITHCDNCGCDWLDNGLNHVGCPYCEQNDWRAAFVAERATRYREGGMAIEQARIHAETDAALILTAALAQQPADKALAAAYRDCCDTPAYCSSVRRCTAKDGKQPDAVAGLVEEVARTIYDEWRDKPGFVGWVEGGNSDMQDQARFLARGAINRALAAQHQEPTT